ncbi:MAG: GNAT family N-acetyltransferase [Spirochaetaceae bacterium]|nr:GNAT family N-acetyltransferase [Spirochaetaceae bacterium]
MEVFHVNEATLVRYAQEEDTPLILEFIRALAEYEHLLDQVEADEASLRKFLFQDHIARVLIGEYQGEPAGFALFFRNFSTFLGKPGIYIEDLFVKPELRGRGLGKILLSFIAKIAAEEHCGRLEWSCLNWNKPSIAFYRGQGARPLSEWTTYRLSGDAIKILGDNCKVPVL